MSGPSDTAPLAPRVLERRRHGVIVAVPIPAGAPAPALAALLPDGERALAATWGEPRVRTFAAGRVALRAALREMGVDPGGPILRTARGAPLVPAGVLASVSHKDELAVAIAALDDGAGARVGVDVEVLDVPRFDVSRHVLTEAELREVGVLDDDARRREVLARFSLKEALYKALDPFVQRFVGFLEVEVRTHEDGTARFELALKHGEGPFVVDGHWSLVSGAQHGATSLPCLLTSVRVRRG